MGLPAPVVLASAEAGPPYLAYILFAVGLAMMFAELFIPGLIVGMTGLFFMIGGIGIGFAQGGPAVGWTMTAIAIVSLPLFLLLWVKLIGPALAVTAKVEDDKDHLDLYLAVLGKQGVALTTLRPSGMALIEGRRIDVVADGKVIEKDTRVEAVDVRGNRVVVRAVRA